MSNSYDYTKISLPKAMTKRIKRYIQDNPELGYRSVSEFIKDIVRDELQKREEKGSLQGRIKELEKIIEEKLRA